MRNFWILGILFITLTLLSCNNDADYASFHYVSRGIDSVAMADTASLGQSVQIKTFTKIRSGCEQFQTHGYDIVGNERTVAVWFIRQDNLDCGEYMDIAPSFNFVPRESGTYHFGFWAGQDEETNDDVFLSKDIYIR